MPISTHKPNMQAITRCWASARRSPLSSAKARTIKPPATHCPKTVKIISGHSCHPLPISHLLRVCQIASGIPGWAAVGIGFDHNIRFGKVSSRQRRNGRQIAMFLRSSSIGPKSSARSGQDSTQIGFSLRNTVITTIAFGHMAFRFVILRCAIRASHMTVTAANAYIFIDHNKTIFTFMHRTARADFSTSRIFAVVT